MADSRKSTSSRGKRASSAARATATKAGGAAARWTEDQVATLMKAVAASPTAKAGFTTAAAELNKSVGTVQQKYYALQRKERGGSEPAAVGGRRRGRPVGSTNRRTAAAPAANGAARSAPTSGQDLRTLTVDELTALARRVKAEVDRRRTELDTAAKLFG